jgi:hypothetical protein
LHRPRGVEGDVGYDQTILVVITRYTQEVEDRIDRDYSAMRNSDQCVFSQEKLLSAAEGADALLSHRPT